MIKPPRRLGQPANSEQPVDRPRMTVEAPPTRRLVAAGLVVVLAFFLMAVGWTATANIPSAAIADGVVVFGGTRKTVQHFEGGIVAELFVQDGDSVAAGQPLIELDTTQTKSELDRLEVQLVASLALEARLLAERDDAAALDLPPFLAARQDRPAVRQVIEDQAALLATRRLAIAERRAILGRKIAQAEAEITGVESGITAQRRVLALLREQLRGITSLVERGLTAKSRFYDLSRDEAELSGAIEANTARIAATRQAITATELEIADLERARANEIASQLPAVRERRQTLEQQRDAARDIVERAVIRAPIAGNVVDLRVDTVGAVLAAAAPVLDIVPAAGPMLVEVRVDPKDRDMLQPGQAAEVRFLAFSQRTTSRVAGRLVSISADRLQDQASAPPYYLARIALEGDLDAALGDNGTLHQGMQAEALIVTGERSVLGYLLRPITYSLGRALREQ